MAYTKHNFADGNVLSASQLNEMEDGIYANDAAKHSHANKAVLDSITAGQVSGWDGLHSLVDAIVSKSDVVDIVGTKAELNAYDTSSLLDKDVVAVLADETHDGAKTFYRWTVSGGIGGWVYIGSEGSTYTKDEIQQMFSGVARIPVITAAASQLTSIELDEDDEDILTGIDLTAEQQEIIEDGTVAALIIDLTALGNGRYFYTKYASTRPNDMEYGQFMGTMLLSEAGVFSTSENRSISFVYNEAFSTYGTLIFTTKHIGTESGGGTSDIYNCIYGTTTLAQIQAAVAAGQLPVCAYDGAYYVYAGTSDGYAYFTSILADTAKRLYVKDSWGSASYTIAKASDIPTVPTALSELTDDVGLAGIKDKLDYLFPYLHGIEYAFSTKTEDYASTTAPAGARMASVESIGMQAVRYNQKVTLTNKTGSHDITYVWNASEQRFRVTGTCSEDSSTFPLFQPTAGSKYYVYIDSENANVKFKFANAMPNVLLTSSSIFSCTSSTGKYFGITSGLVPGQTYDFGLSLFIVDLTAMFGAGNEPTTVSDPRIAWLDGYLTRNVAYNAGTLITADAEKIKYGSTEQTIPAAIRALPGYGLGLKDAPNELQRTDYGWKYVQRVEAGANEGDLPTLLAETVETDVSSLMSDALDPKPITAGGKVVIGSEDMLTGSTVKYMINVEEALG